MTRVDETGVRVLYGLNGMPPREAFDSGDITTAFTHVFLRYRRATLQPLEAMRIDDMRVVLTTVDLTPPEPWTWYVRLDGNDGNADDDPEAPFRTISHALAWARAGDSIETGGGVYTERPVFPYSGEPEAPVTLRAAPENNRFDRVEVDYGAVNRNRLVPGSGASVLPAGDNHVFTNGRVGRSYGRSIEISGSGTVISNTVSHDASSHLITLHGAVGAGAYVSANTVYRSGDTAIDIGAKASVIEFNHAYHAGMRITDIVVLNTWNSGDMEGTEIRYNWAHSNLAPWDVNRSWWGGQGIRLDSGGAPLGCSNARIHHNVVWNTTSRSSLTFWGLEEGMENFGNSQIEVYHNTLDDLLVFGGSGSVAGGDVRNRNFQLRPGSAAIGVGTPVTGVTESFPENYLGAYNPGADPWTPGAHLRPGDLRHLVTSVETGALGQTSVLVTGLPPGRNFPDAFFMRPNGHEAVSWVARYVPSGHSVTGVFTFDLAAVGSTAAVEFSLDGTEWVVPAAATVALPAPVITTAGPLFGTAAGRGEHVITGEHLVGPTVPLQALDLGGLAGRIFTVFRNPDPGPVKWQRLYSSRSGTDVFDYEAGFYAIVPTTSEGDPTAHPLPTLREMNRQGDFSGENFRIGRRSLSTAEPFRGEIAEMIAFSGDFSGVPRAQVERYLQRKYGIAERPAVNIPAGETVEPLRVFVGGEVTPHVLEHALSVLPPHGSLRFHGVHDHHARPHLPACP